MKRAALPLLFIVLVFILSCKKNGKIPLITTQRPYMSAVGKATCGGAIYTEGDDEITEKGICWSTHSNPTTSDFYTKDGSGSGNFSSTLVGVKMQTTYFIKAYATNKYGTAYGSEEALTIPLGAPPPAVMSRGAYSITLNSAVSGGTVTIVGDVSSILEAGVCWSSTGLPTKEKNSHITATVSPTGVFICPITDLSANTTYTLRAYATNSTGTSYGDTKVSKTMFGTMTDNDNNTYYTVAIGSQIWMAENFRGTTYRNGNPIPHMPDNTQWTQTPTSGAYAYFNNIASNEKYGALYSWKAVSNTSSISPAGWHVPTQSEYSQLIFSLGNSSTASASLKTADPAYWSNLPKTNASGFSALPAGFRNYAGGFYNLSLQTQFWTKTTVNAASVYTMILDQMGQVSVLSTNIDGGYSLRLVKD